MLAVLCLCVPGLLNAHAGHDAIPEATVAQVGEIAPRFYARSEAIDATLVLDNKNAGHLYLFNHNTNEPLAAKATVSQLTPVSKDVEVQATATTGVYQLNTPLDLSTTATVSVEVENADTFDVLAFSNIVLPPATAADSATDHNLGVSASHNNLLNITLKWAALLVLILAVSALIKYLFTRRRTSTNSALFLLISMSLTILDAPLATAHEGDTHMNEGLASTGAAGPAANNRHFISVETQALSDIQTSTAQLLNLPAMYETTGRVEVQSDREAIITAPTDGLLMPSSTTDSIAMVGDHVKAGEVLLRLQMIIPAADKVTISAEKVAADAELNQARQESSLARQELERGVKLGTYVSKSELDRLKTAYQIAQDKETGLQNRIQTLTAALEGDTTGIKTLEVRAPISGIVSESHSTRGEYVNAGKALFRIVNIEHLYVRADIFESDLSSVNQAEKATIAVEAFPDRTFEGKFYSLSPEIDPVKRTAAALFQVDNTEGLLRSGMFTRVSIESGKPQPTLVVPKDAIVSRDNVRQVYRKVGPEIYDAVPVQVTRYLASYAVLEGDAVKPGDVLVTRGHYQVRMAPVVGTAGQ